jgi:hypothetical protein
MLMVDAISMNCSQWSEHYIGLACNWPAPSFRVGVDCHEVPMVLVRAEDEEHSKPIWLVKALSSFNFV